jgi:hypothetical protein
MTDANDSPKAAGRKKALPWDRSEPPLLLTHRGLTAPLAWWAQHSGLENLTYPVLYHRVAQAGWPASRALTQPVCRRRGKKTKKA